MTSYECTPDVAISVAGQLTGLLDHVETARIALVRTAASNATFDLTTGIQTLGDECVEEAGLVATVLTSCASAAEHADGSFFDRLLYDSQAGQALALLLGSLSDGRGDLGKLDAKTRYQRLLREIWPNGIPSSLDQSDVVSMVMNSLRAKTMTDEELSTVWPLMPGSGRRAFAGTHPVTVLDLVVDGGLVLNSGELDAAARSVLASPPSGSVDVDPELAAKLRAAGQGRFGLPVLDRTGVTIDRAQILMDAGPAGRAYRDAVNSPLTYAALVVGLQAGGAARRTPDGLIVVTVPAGAKVGIDDLIGTKVGGPEMPPFAKGGTTFGNTFIVPDGSGTAAVDDVDLQRHENIHTYQWAAAGPAQYATLYGAESLKSGVQDFKEHGVDVKVDTFDLGPIGPSVTFPIPGGSFTLGVKVDPPPLPYRVELDPHFDTGCGNRFEQDAGLEDGNYSQCSR